MSGRVEVEFEYVPDEGVGGPEVDGRIAFGVLLELAAHAVDAALPGHGIEDVRFGPPLRLDGPRRCHASVDPSSSVVQVTSIKLATHDARAVTHLSARPARLDELEWRTRLAGLPRSSEPGETLTAERVASELGAGGHSVAAIPSVLTHVEVHAHGLTAEIASDASWTAYRVHPLLADCGWLLASFWMVRQGVASAVTPASAVAFHVFEAGARIDRLRLIQLPERFAGASAELAIIAERAGEVIAFVFGLQTTHETRLAGLERTAFAGVVQPGELARELMRSAPRERRAVAASCITRLVIAALARPLDLSDLPADVTFRDLGLTSAHATAVAAALSEALDEPVATTLLFDHPTIDALAAALVERRRSGSERDAAVASTAMPHARAGEAIAVIGVGCRFPGRVYGPQDYWKLLSDRGDATAALPSDRVELVEGIRAHRPSQDAGDGSAAVSKLNAVDDVWEFDAAFFGISPREATMMDPQHRLVLQTTWEALERAGILPGTLQGTATGVFVGITSGDYAHLVGDIDAYTSSGMTPSAVAGRIAYFLDLRGPALAVDTACSSSLAAVHLAARSLNTGECDLAIVAGVNLVLSPKPMIALDRLGAFSRRGRCMPFDDAADGFVRGEGCGVVILKRLETARSDGDTVVATVAGSALSQDGRSNGLTAPNATAQVAVIEHALRNGNVRASEVGYVEAHGTGTRIGDAIELEALARAYGPGRSADAPLLVGSVKGNIGHLEAAAGIAGFIKAVLVLRHQRVVPQAWLDDERRLIADAGLPIAIARAEAPEPRARPLRYAGVSSFGLTGTNAHVVLEHVPARAIVEPPARPAYLLPLSAKHGGSLMRQLKRVADWMGDTLPNVGDVCWTAATARTHFPVRLALRGTSATDLVASLRRAQLGANRLLHPVDASRGITFVFSGHGGQWLGMGRELQAQEPVFARALADCDVALAPLVGFSVRDELANDAGPLQADAIGVVQPVVFALQVALSRLWRSWGVVPSGVIGHSMGEVAAAHVAGVLSLEQAAFVIATRSALLQRMSGRGGRMLVVELPLNDAIALAASASGVAVAASNGPTTNVLTGSEAVLAGIAGELSRRKVFHRWVRVTNAGHTAELDEQRAVFVARLRALAPRTSELPFYSSCRARVSDGAELGPEYWFENLRARVRFAETARLAVDDGARVFLEVGPHPLLRGGIQDTLRAAGQDGLAIGSLERDTPDLAAMYSSLGALYEAGYDPLWRAVMGRGSIVDMPTYAWFGRSLRVQPARSVSAAAGEAIQEASSHAVVPVAADESELDVVHEEVASAIRVERANLSLTENLIAAGLDSLIVQEIRNRIWRRTGVALPVWDFFQEPTVEAVARRLRCVRTEKESRASQPKSPEDAASARFEHLADTFLARDLPTCTVRPQAPMRAVLVTGATGFLGAHVICELLAHTSTVVHCLIEAADVAVALRGLEASLDEHGLAASSAARIRAVPGWLGHPRFGLDEREFARLAEEVDLVLHCGEQAEPLRAYPDLRAVNVLGTLEAVRLAMQGGAALCFVSTIDVVSARTTTEAADGAVPSEKTRLDRPEALATGYAQTKWVAEEIVREAQRRGLRGSVVRPGALIGARSNGAMPPSTVVGGLIAGLVELGACFEAGVVDLPPLCAVDEVASAIVRLACHDREQSTAAGVRHLVNPQRVTIAQLATWIRSFGYPLHEMDYATWRELAFARPSQNRLQPFETLLERAVEGQLFARVECAESVIALAHLGLQWSQVDEHQVHAVLRHFVACGVLAPPASVRRATGVDANRRC